MSEGLDMQCKGIIRAAKAKAVTDHWYEMEKKREGRPAIVLLVLIQGRLSYSGGVLSLNHVSNISKSIYLQCRDDACSVPQVFCVQALWRSNPPSTLL